MNMQTPSKQSVGKGSVAVAGAGGAAITFQWVWGIWVPDTPMPSEVAIFLSGIFTLILNRILN